VYEFNTVFGQINFVHTLLRHTRFLLNSFSGVQKAAKKSPRGRPRTGKVRMQIKLSPQANKLIKQRASKLGISRSEYIERAVLAANLQLDRKHH
jgi:hypothetical protein